MNNTKNNPMLSVFMITYNHEKYIKQALDGILMQKVNFPYEIIIGDDCSQDNTQNILKEFKKKYPLKIKLLLHKENIGIKENVNSVWRECSGKYIASCEGDDFWIDEYKLQKQVQFLEKNPQYIGTTHKFQIVDEKNKKIDKELKHYFSGRIYNLSHAKDFLMPGQTATLVYRNILKDNFRNFELLENCEANGDRKLSLFLSLFGEIYCFDEVMSAYRVIETHGDSWSAKTKGKNMILHRLNTFKELSYLAKEIKNVNINFKAQYLECGLTAFYILLTKPNKENLFVLKEVYKNTRHKKEMIFFICIKFSKKILTYCSKKIKKAIFIGKKI